jgi:4-hydroxyphenylpyruvate 3-dimethylallyltransferase
MSFSSKQCLEDISRLAAVINAPFSESTTSRVLDAYADHFATSAVLWKTTDRPGDSLCYRFYAPRPSDTLSVAIRAGLLDPSHALVPLMRSWSALYDGTPEQSCDFDAGRGLAKTWLHLAGTRPLTDILNAENVPATLRRHELLLRRLGLEHVRFVSVDYRHDSVNIYFLAPGPVTENQSAQIAAMAQSAPPPPRRFAELSELLPKNAYMLAVTVSVRTGDLQRVCFYAPMLPAGRFPAAGERLSLFFAEAPCYDEEEATVAAWSFGADGGTYLKGERGWFGDLAGTFRRWAAFSSGDEQVAPAPVR